MLNMIRRSVVEALVETLSLDMLAALRRVIVVRGSLRCQSIKWSLNAYGKGHLLWFAKWV
jgi:hypothetical protein